MTKIIITGGHHNAALVVADLLRARGVSVVWIGHRHAARGDRQKSAEYLEVTAHNFPFHALQAGRFTLSLQEIIRLPVGFFQSWSILRKEQPDAVLSFGGYLGAAVALSAALLGIRVYLHEQTRSAGLANKLIGKFARRIYLTWPDSQRHFKKEKIKVVGLPLRQNILDARPAILFDSKLPNLLVLGGKQGSHRLNTFIFKHIHDLLPQFNIIHQTGTSSVTGDHAKSLTLKESLGSKGQGYLPVNYISETDIGPYLKAANVYLGRSGAHITYELAVLGLPSVLVPFMHTHDAEQQQNAQYLKSVGLGEVVSESELTLTGVLAAIKQVMGRATPKQKLTSNAGETLVNDVLRDVRGD